MNETEKNAPEGNESIERARVRSAARSALFGDTAEPVKIGRFVEIELLGEGGMGVVYEAYDPKLRREVAIKLLRSVEADTSSAARLEREAQAMARVCHKRLAVQRDDLCLGLAVEPAQRVDAMVALRGSGIVRLCVGGRCQGAHRRRRGRVQSPAEYRVANEARRGGVTARRPTPPAVPQRSQTPVALPARSQSAR